MNEAEKPRKTIQHFNVQNHAHLLTFSCYQRMPLLNDAGRCTALSRRIDWATQHQNFNLIAFVYMPEHVHLLVFAATNTSKVEQFLYAVKKPLSDIVKRTLQVNHDPLLSELTLSVRPGKSLFRFWQQGPGYDRNVLSMKHAVQAAEYIHNNPIRRGLCAQPDQWRWSSWKFYHAPNAPRDDALPFVHGFPGSP